MEQGYFVYMKHYLKREDKAMKIRHLYTIKVYVNINA